MTRDLSFPSTLLIFEAAMTLAAISLAPSPASAASLTPLGGLPGGSTYGEAYGVSGDGSVVVGYVSSASGYPFEAFRWTSGGGMVGLGHLPGGYSSEAYGVSADGSVIVGLSRGAYVKAFRWTSDGGMVGLGNLPGGTDSWARGVSGDGSVVVGSSYTASGYPDAFRWTSDGGMVGLGSEFFGVATGVSADGSVIVGYDNGAFRWTSDAGMVGLGNLPGGTSSEAWGVNADGSVIVGVSYSVDYREAFRWTSDGGMVGLGYLPGGAVFSNAWGVSGDGSVIVGNADSGGSLGEAFRWTSDGGMERLWDVLLAEGVDPAADGWTWLSDARGVSDDGNTIVGRGIRNGATEAFVAVIPTIVPEPAAGALALLGVSSILLFRRRSLGRPNKVSLSKDELCN